MPKPNPTPEQIAAFRDQLSGWRRTIEEVRDRVLRGVREGDELFANFDAAAFERDCNACIAHLQTTSDNSGRN